MLNKSFFEIPPSYLFDDVSKRVAAYQKAHPEASLLRMGVGDVTRPLPAASIDALVAASEEQGSSQGFRGYGPEQGYSFLRDAIASNEYGTLGVNVDPRDIFISDGAKSDAANIQELFSDRATVAIADPVYPVYVDSNALSGRLGSFEGGRWSNLTYLPCTRENGYVPPFPDHRPDLIYLCYPNNPTGATLSREELAQWVAYARQEGSVILFDAAYRAFITDEAVPRSIYEIEGGDQVAIEFGSFSKTAGFTGLRCSWTVVPQALRVDGHSLRDMWARRQSTKFNGVPYVVQRAAQAIYTPQGRRQTQESVDYYLRNAALLRGALSATGSSVSGGVNAPYVWFPCPGGMDSWQFFDYLLENAQIVGTPGVGFGPSGQGYFRLSAFATHEDTKEACVRLERLLGSQPHRFEVRAAAARTETEV